MSSIGHRAAKRRRRAPAPTYAQSQPSGFFASSLAAEEERMLAQAIANSRVDRGRDGKWLSNIPFGPTFYPSVEDFSGDPLKYFEKIRPVAEKYGICKIVPPKGWDPPFALDIDSKKRFQTKDQSIDRLQEGVSFGDGAEYTIKEYQKMASEWSKEWRDKYYSIPQMDKGPDPEKSTTSNNLENNKPETVSSSSRTILQGHGAGKILLNEKSSGDPEGNKFGTDFVECEKQTVPTSEFKMTPENLERDYWDIVETQSHEVDVDYGNDVDTSEFGSGFPMSERGRSVNSQIMQASGDENMNDKLPEPLFGTEEYYKETYWNLNNIPNSRNGVLQHVKVGINGINVPWLYFGCLFSTFCWHTEDNYMYSINYHHKGAPKQWYGVPGTKKDADGVERVFKNYLSIKMRDTPDLMHHITTSFSPRMLTQERIRVCKLTQHAGQFIVTFPRAFHGGFNLGPNVGEAVNFALHDWMQHGADANERYRSFARPSVFSHDRLIYTIAHHINGLPSKKICKTLSQELRRMMEEELLLRKRLIESGVRDVSKEVDLPPNQLDQLDEESADYDDKRLCHSCKHICFFSAVACGCSESKVSCLRHSHYMCRCSTKRKYLLTWTSEKEMKEAISKVEKRSDELKEEDSSTNVSNHLSNFSDDELEGAPDSAMALISHQTFEVPVDPICSVDCDVPPLVSSDSPSPKPFNVPSVSKEQSGNRFQGSLNENEEVLNSGVDPSSIDRLNWKTKSDDIINPDAAISNGMFVSKLECVGSPGANGVVIVGSRRQ